MRLAVVMAAYNSAPYIADALASLLRQRDAAALDIIVVNDGSTDATADIVRSIADEAPEVRLIETPNRGPSAARNAALESIAPDTDLVTNLDADDMSPAGRFARDIASFEADPGLDFHYGRMRVFRRLGADRLSPSPDQFVDIRGIQFGAALFRRSLVERVGRYEESMLQGEDTDYLFRMFQLRPKMKVVDDICVYYRRHDANITNDRVPSMRFYAQAILKHARRQQGGGLAVPPGFFDCRALASVDWW